MRPYLKILLIIFLSVSLVTILVSCKKPSLPEVTTQDVTEINQTTAKSGGNVVNNGGEDVTARGVCWSTSPDPTEVSSKTLDGRGNGAFTSSINGLNANTKYYVRAYATNSEGTGYGDQVSLTTLENLPEAAFTASPTVITINQTVQFLDQSTNSPTSWIWDFGDGGTSTLQNPSHKYSTAGTYTVSLSATNSAGSDTETKSNHITVGISVVSPIAAFTASSTIITTDESVQFTDQSLNNPTSWSWDFGDGGTSTLPNPSHTYTTTGKYTISLTVNNTAGSNKMTKSNYITVNPPPVLAPIAAFTAIPTTITVGQSVQFTDQSTNEPTSWSWNFGDGNESTSKSPLHTYLTVGTFTVSLTVTSAGGQTLKRNPIILQ